MTIAISIYTRTNNVLTIEYWKWFFKKFFLKKDGPSAVLDSLIRSLSILKIPFEVNPKKPQYEIVHIISGIEILKKMIQYKKESRIKKLIVGPNINMTPFENDSIMMDCGIDKILFPSKWPLDYYCSFFPPLNLKSRVWPAGVEMPLNTSSKRGPILVYKKNIPEEIFNSVINTLDELKLKYEIIIYGRYKRNDYLDKLKNTPLLIYLQYSESQGLALQEAWSFDVPTLVWQNETWKYKEYTWTADNMSAPYLTPECGSFFKTENLRTILIKTINNELKFTPHSYCAKTLSDAQSIKRYLGIINEI